MAKILDIYAMYAYTDTGHRFHVSQIKGNPVVGATIDPDTKEILGIAEAAESC